MGDCHGVERKRATGGALIVAVLLGGAALAFAHWPGIIDWLDHIDRRARMIPDKGEMADRGVHSPFNCDTLPDRIYSYRNAHPGEGMMSPLPRDLNIESFRCDLVIMQGDKGRAQAEQMTDDEIVDFLDTVKTNLRNVLTKGKP